MPHSMAHDYGHRQEHHSGDHQYRDHQNRVQSLASALSSHENSPCGLAPLRSIRRLARKCGAVKGMRHAPAPSSSRQLRGLYEARAWPIRTSAGLPGQGLVIDAADVRFGCRLIGGTCHPNCTAIQASMESSDGSR
jgi:hypothetical protein